MPANEIDRLVILIVDLAAYIDFGVTYAILEEKEIRMTIPFEEFKAESLADPEVKREYDALAPEFEAYAKKLRARKRGKTKAPKSRRIVKPDRNPPPQR
jgi:hypothetical protein